MITDMRSDSIVFDVSSEGLDPMKHRICGITVKTLKEEVIFTDRNERKLLQDFWMYIGTNGFNKIIGFNSDKFDIPMVMIRSIKHGVKMPSIKGKTVDLRKVIFDDEHHKGTLEDFMELLGLHFTENGFKKMHMSILWEANDIAELKDYLMIDAKVTWELYSRLMEVGLIG